MPDSSKGGHERVLPSAFMRKLRPEYYSDTEDRTTYHLEQATLSHHLETITARNQTHDFEIFCRKLCEQTICPNLLPATGPEGGGDSKADTETIPVADEIANLMYVGEPNAGRERWAFAFSAKEKWAEKVRKDVRGIVETNRGYKKIYCVTSRLARAKDRARIEDELTQRHGLTIHILDRTWIVEQVIERRLKHLAFNYLGVGTEVPDIRRLGPSDYSRAQQLDDIEKELSNPQAFAGMEMQRATEALVAAKLSRNLERPRTETDGRFLRAVRLAEGDGTYRQRLEAHYEWIWTGFWWFDDFALLNSGYDAFETLALETDHAKNIEFLCNLAQLLFNCVVHRHLTASDAKLHERITRLSDRLRLMSEDAERANHALEAQTSLLVIEVNRAWLDRDLEKLASFWPKFSDVVERARGLGEFAADRLVRLIEVFGNVAGKDRGYARLVEDVAAFVSERTSEGEGALVLLKRAQQLDVDDHFERIRLLGKAVRQLAKKEYADSLIEAARLLSMAYRSAGLLWAARASCIFALASIFIEAEEDHDVPVSVVPTILLLTFITVELRHLPDLLEAIRLVRGCAVGLPLDDASKERLTKELEELDLMLSSYILNFLPNELERVANLPDVFGRIDLYRSRASLLYALGHEARLREDGWIPAGKTPEWVEEFFGVLASQPVSENVDGPVIFNEPEKQIYVAVVLGMRIAVHHEGSEASTLLAEAIAGSIEALFATALDLDAYPHTEGFTVTIEERPDSTPDVTLDHDRMTATVHWPSGRLPATYGSQGDVQKLLLHLASLIFAVTCKVRDTGTTIERLFQEEGVLDRVAVLMVIGNSHQRVFNKSVSRLSDWTKLAETAFALKPTHPKIVRRKLETTTSDRELKKASGRPKDHRELLVRSVIDVHLWDRAGWTGTAFAECGPGSLPIIALLFKGEDAATKIFQRWQERFGQVDEHDEIYLAIVRGISDVEPAHYRLLITSRLPPEMESPDGKLLMIPSRTQTMTVQSDANLERFLRGYEFSGEYFLMPAIWNENGTPELLIDLAVRKRKLSVRVAAEIGEHDIEVMALGPR